MWQRIRTAIVLVAIVGVAMFAFDSHYPFILLLLIGGSFAQAEWRKFLPAKTDTSKPSTAEIIFLISPVLIGLLALNAEYWPIAWGVAVVMWAIAIKWILEFPDKITWFDTRIAPVGVLFLGSALTAMYYLWSQSPWWLMYVFVLVWCADSGAYFVGRKFGKRKMAPKVSPNKSMEGLYGGLATGLIAVGVVCVTQLDYSGLQLACFVLLSAVTIVISVFGDLFESMLKRQAGIKDSGTILPGHGGVLDRIDSLLSATPVFALGFWLMAKQFG